MLPRPLRRAVTALVLLTPLLLVAPAAPAAPAQASEPAPRPQIAEGRVLDSLGRVLVLHGVNMVAKLDPYAPDELGFGRDDARFLARQGFTTVRLGLIWKAVEPQPGEYDDAYLARIRRTTRVLADHGIRTLLDFHQDLYHERFQGEGAPDWAVLDDGLPSQPQLGFPNNYFVNLGLNRAFDNFWANAAGPGGVGLQDRYAAAWAHVATFFRGTPGVLGIDVFNEPWPGTGWQLCINPLGCPTFDGRLEAFTQRVVDAVRAVDPATPVFYEPNVLFNNGVATLVTPTGTDLGFSFHDYCLTADLGLDAVGLPTGEDDPLCGTFDDLVWRNAASHIAGTGHAGLLTEFGATSDTAVLRDMVARAQAADVGWQYWAYCGCDDPTTTGPGAEQALVTDPAAPLRGDNIDRAKLRALVIPYAQAVAGTPSGSTYDRGTRTFTTGWDVARIGGGTFDAGARSRIVVPRLVYRDGYRVEATGARVVSRPGARVLVVAQRPGAREVRVTVTPR